MLETTTSLKLNVDYKGIGISQSYRFEDGESKVVYYLQFYAKDISQEEFLERINEVANQIKEAVSNA